MPEITAKEQLTQVESVGIRILGQDDPRKMTLNQFNNSPELLFHGTSHPMQFSPTFDYHSKEYLTQSDGSTTLGFGFYTTDNEIEAKNYSIVRQGGGKVQPIIIRILPYQARVLDLRQKK